MQITVVPMLSRQILFTRNRFGSSLRSVAQSERPCTCGRSPDSGAVRAAAGHLDAFVGEKVSHRPSQRRAGTLVLQGVRDQGLLQGQVRHHRFASRRTLLQDSALAQRQFGSPGQERAQGENRRLCQRPLNHQQE